MNTPLYAAVEEYVSRDMSRFHMPGHKGRGLSAPGDAARYDLTEVTGLDSLYEADGAIAATEAEYTRLYGSAGSFLSAGGSTLCIQSMLALAAPDGGKVVAARGVHAAAVNAMALLNLAPVWVYPEFSVATGLPCGISPDALEQALRANPDADCVYVTSPTYFGILSDIAVLSEVCRRYSVPLLVDNAHGAHLKFLTPSSLHPLDLGADICCDSLHKTLPVLTGGAMLHVKNPRYLRRAKQMMALFGSTSPSYLIMLSADMVLPYLETQITEDLARVSSRLSAIAAQARAQGMLTVQGSCDPLRITMGFSSAGYTKSDFAELLSQCYIEPEYLSEHFCVFMASGHNDERDFSRLEALARQLKPGTPVPLPKVSEAQPQQVMPLRTAMLSPGKPVAVDESAGEVAAGMVSPCPPGIPIVIPGEKIDGATVTMLKNYGITRLNVVL